VITLSESTTATSFTRTITWQYSPDSGSTWYSESTAALSGGTNQATYQFAIRCGLHAPLTCSNFPAQYWYRVQIADTDNTLLTYSYSPIITINVTALTPQALILTSNSSSSLNGSSIQLTTSGGGGTGAISFVIISGGTATGCSTAGSYLSASTSGTCLVQPLQASDLNYVGSSGSVSTFFVNYVFTNFLNQMNNNSSKPVGTTGIGGGVVGLGLQSVNNVSGPSSFTVTGLSSTSGSAGSVITITGTGFLDGNNNPLVASVTYNGGLDVCQFTIVSSTQISVTVPSTEVPNGSSGGDQFAVAPTSGATVFTPTFTVT
jgi:hypothetical protein